jgi:uncharacterized protein
MPRNDPLDGFDWDESNGQKNWERHGVTPEEAEEIFFHEPLVMRADVRHGEGEKRYYALGQTNSGRLLFTAFTIRRKLIRVISTRIGMKRRFIGHMKEIPKFKNEDGERKFWAAADSTKYVDWSRGGRKKLVDLRPSLRTISLRLPVAMIEDLKLLANQRDVPYQSLLKVFLAERLAKERPRRATAR